MASSIKGGSSMLFESKWLTYKTGEYASADAKYGNPAPYFRKSFTLSRKPERATLFVSALGVFYIWQVRSDRRSSCKTSRHDADGPLTER